MKSVYRPSSINCVFTHLCVVAECRKRLVRGFLSVAFIGVLGTTLPAQVDSANGPFRTQTIELKAGWNAVYLEVDPLDTDPNTLFEGTLIECVANYSGDGSTRQFVSNLSIDLTRAAGWLRWYPNSVEHSFLSNLGEVYGGQCYLIKTTESFSLKVRGSPVLARMNWIPDAYNFVGFSVAESGGPSFYEFFEGSDAHSGQVIYKLSDGVWMQVLNPTADALAYGEAFWIFCNGNSDYQGPLQVDVPGIDGLVLVDNPLELVLTNRSSNPVSYSIDHVLVGDFGVPMSFQVNVLGDTDAPVRSVPVDFPSTAWEQNFPAMEGDFSIRMPVALRRSDLVADGTQSYLMFESSLATRVWVPVRVLSTIN